MRKRLLASFSGAALMATALVLPAFAAPAYTLSGEASQSNGSVTLVSDASPGYGLINFAYSGSTPAGLQQLGTDFNVTDDDCKNGSPRFRVKVTTDSGTKSIFVYLGPSPNFTGCPANTWVPSGDLLEPGKTIDTSQLTGGTFYHEYSAALVMFGTLPVTGIQLVSDSGYAFGDGEQTVMVDNTFINNDTYTYNAACTQVDASGLTGYWKFDEAAGVVSIDSAGADNNGANENGPAYVPGNPVVQPNVTALQFDGTDDQVRAATARISTSVPPASRCRSSPKREAAAVTARYWGISARPRKAGGSTTTPMAEWTSSATERWVPTMWHSRHPACSITAGTMW